MWLIAYFPCEVVQLHERPVQLIANLCRTIRSLESLVPRDALLCAELDAKPYLLMLLLTVLVIY